MKEKIKKMSQKIKDNKKKIIIGIGIVGGVTCLILKQNKTIKQLKLNDIKQEHDIDILRSVMSENILSSLKDTITRKLRYNEGRLANGLKDGVMTIEDEMKRREMIEFYSRELKKIFDAEQILKGSKEGN